MCLENRAVGHSGGVVNSVHVAGGRFDGVGGFYGQLGDDEEGEKFNVCLYSKRSQSTGQAAD